jgi:uncharacterized protein (DUF1684 family)
MAAVTLPALTTRLRWRALAALLLAFGAARCSSGPPPPPESASYEQEMIDGRRLKDEFFKTGSDSPIPEIERPVFKGLVYFPIDKSYRVPASLDQAPSNPPVAIILPTSRNIPRRMVKVGTLRFTLAGSTMALTAFAGEGEGLNRLFVPFGDTTNRGDTYGGGRYLEMDLTPTGLYDLDFNRATNPYCVYNVSYDCPIPPPENRMTIAIRAGEKMPG